MRIADSGSGRIPQVERTSRRHSPRY
jgi:hypothetical protein